MRRLCTERGHDAAATHDCQLIDPRNDSRAPDDLVCAAARRSAAWAAQVRAAGLIPGKIWNPETPHRLHADAGFVFCTATSERNIGYERPGPRSREDI
jgi:hypothetical protein